PRHLIHQDPLLPRQLVQQAGLAYVGPADKGHPPGPASGALRLARGLRQGRENDVEQVATPPAVQGADRVRLAKPPRPQRPPPAPGHPSAARAGAGGASPPLSAAPPTGFPDRRSPAATASSASVIPTTASTTNSTASAASTES